MAKKDSYDMRQSGDAQGTNYGVSKSERMKDTQKSPVKSNGADYFPGKVVVSKYKKIGQIGGMNYPDNAEAIAACQEDQVSKARAQKLNKYGK